MVDGRCAAADFDPHSGVTWRSATQSAGAGNHTALYQGLAGGVCPCPHYGYVFEGRLRCRYPGTDWPDEIATTGDAYFFRSGHVLIYEEETKALELNPAAALQTLMDHIESLARRHSGHENGA